MAAIRIARGRLRRLRSVLRIDRVRSWEILGEVVKAANGAEDYTGEDSRISSRLQTKFMVVMNNSTPKILTCSRFSGILHAPIFFEPFSSQNIHRRSTAGCSNARDCTFSARETQGSDGRGGPRPVCDTRPLRCL